MNETIVRYDGEDFVVMWDLPDASESPVIYSVLVNDNADIFPLLSMTGLAWFQSAIEAEIQNAKDDARIEQWEATH